VNVTPSQVPGEPTTPMAASPRRTPAPIGPSGPRATFVERLCAELLDGFIVFVPLVILAYTLGGLGAGIWLALYAAYFTFFEGGPTGQTLGKRALKIRVVDLRTGGPIRYVRGFVRALMRFWSAFFLYIGYLWMLWDRESQTWHDKAASTVVVPASASPGPT
jgi:uncharacterized RDD family membrane protein YckC